MLFSYYLFFTTVIYSAPTFASEIVLMKRTDASFSHSPHSEAFNVVHLIAAVVGILGAAAIGIAAFIMCRRRRRRQKDTDIEKPTNNNSTLSASVIQSPSVIHTIKSIPKTSRFNQFASAYCFDERQPTSSPSVQHPTTHISSPPPPPYQP